jgi:hypothetical protein
VLSPIMSGPLADVVPGDVVVSAAGGKMFLVQSVSDAGIVVYGCGYIALPDGSTTYSGGATTMRRATAEEAEAWRAAEADKHATTNALAFAMRRL